MRNFLSRTIREHVSLWLLGTGMHKMSLLFLRTILKMDICKLLLPTKLCSSCCYCNRILTNATGSCFWQAKTKGILTSVGLNLNDLQGSNKIEQHNTKIVFIQKCQRASKSYNYKKYCVYSKTNLNLAVAQRSSETKYKKIN